MEQKRAARPAHGAMKLGAKKLPQFWYVSRLSLWILETDEANAWSRAIIMTMHGPGPLWCRCMVQGHDDANAWSRALVTLMHDTGPYGIPALPCATGIPTQGSGPTGDVLHTHARTHTRTHTVPHTHTHAHHWKTDAYMAKIDWTRVRHHNQRRKKVHSYLPPLNVFGGIWHIFGGTAKSKCVIVFVRVASPLAKPASTQSQWRVGLEIASRWWRTRDNTQTAPRMHVRHNRTTMFVSHLLHTN